MDVPQLPLLVGVGGRRSVELAEVSQSMLELAMARLRRLSYKRRFREGYLRALWLYLRRLRLSLNKNQKSLKQNKVLGYIILYF